MKVYIAGPMTGLPDFNYPAFHQAEQDLIARGYEVVCPTSNSGGSPPPVEEAKPWDWYLRKAISLLLTCEGIYLLPGWENSKGARLEEHIASELGMEVIL